MKAGAELEGYGVIGPGVDGERQHGAQQHHIGQLQQVWSESSVERSAEHTEFESLAPGSDQPADSDDERQREHQNADRQEAQTALAVPGGHDHEDGDA